MKSVYYDGIEIKYSNYSIQERPIFTNNGEYMFTEYKINLEGESDWDGLTQDFIDRMLRPRKSLAINGFLPENYQDCNNGPITSLCYAGFIRDGILGVSLVISTYLIDSDYHLRMEFTA